MWAGPFPLSIKPLRHARRLLTFDPSMSRAILKSTSATGLATLLSRITGMLRDTVMAQAMGIGPVSDAFLVAFKIPNFLRRLFAEGAFSQSFVPVISEYKVNRGQAEVRELVAGVAGTLARAVRVSIVGVGRAIDHLALPAAPGRSRVHGSTTRGAELAGLPYCLRLAYVAVRRVLNSHGRFSFRGRTQSS